jgi:CBS domain-containing protein
VKTRRAAATSGEARETLETHQGFPVINSSDQLVGVITRRDYAGKPPETRVGDLVRHAPSVVFLDNSLRDAADHMVRENVGRLPVVSREDPRRVIGIITRSDLLSAHARRLSEEV